MTQFSRWLVFSTIVFLLVVVLAFLLPAEKVAAIAGFGAFAMFVLQKIYERTRELERQLRDRKVPVYEKLVRTYVDFILQRAEQNQSFSLRDINEFTREISPDFINWGSDEFIRTFAAFRRKYGKPDGGNPTPADIIVDFEQLMLAIRRDLGHTNRDLKALDLTCMLFSNVHILEPLIEKRRRQST
jgi:hypothetical protein